MVRIGGDIVKHFFYKALQIASMILMGAVLLTSCSPFSGIKNPGMSKTGNPSPETEFSKNNTSKEFVTLSFLMAWNGSAINGMADSANNAVAKVLREKTGVSLEIEYATTNEAEKLNIIFASGEMPDIINAPYWGSNDSSTVVIKRAAREGLLLDWNPLIEQYGSNLKDAFTTGINKDYIENDVNDPSFGGKHFVLPQQSPKTQADILNSGDGLYCRKDILEKLGVAPESIVTADDLYQFMKKIKNGGFTDINGKPVIPGGAWHDGWNYMEFLRPFYQHNLRTEIDKVDGKFVYTMNNPIIEQRVLWMRKIVSERLFDPECFRQSDTQAKEKMSTGRIAIFGAHFFHQRDFLSKTLYVTHPEMQYVPIGPLEFYGGERTLVSTKGRSGTPGLLLTKTCKNPAAAVRFLNYLNSDEGQLYAYYGIEGIHYTMVDGKPRMTKEWLAKWKSNPQQLYNLGIRSTFMDMICLDQRMSAYGEVNPGDADNKDPYYEMAKEFNQKQFIEGYRINYLFDKYSDIDKIRPLMDYNYYRDVIEKAYFADSDEEALKIINENRAILKQQGMDQFEQWLNEEAAKRDDIIW
jgi:ABC-type sugar transport system, periplasmic component